MISLKIRDVMTAEVITVAPETPLKDVAHLMIDHAVSGIPVVDHEGVVIGVVSEADLLVKERGVDAIHRRPLAGLIGDSKTTREQRDKVSAGLASQAMTSPAITIGPERPLREAADLMIERRVNRLPVVSAEGALLGIVTRADIVRAFTRTDAELERIVREEILRRALWIEPYELLVHVADGIVSIRGTVDRRSTAEVLERLIAQVDGVVAVDADLDWRVDDSRVEAERPEMVYHANGR
jgi:CBS domain-containing protein